MTPQTDALRSGMLAAPEAARAQLAVELLGSHADRSVETGRAELDRVWADETARRAQQIDSGEATTGSWDDVLVRVDQARRAR